MRKTFTVLEGDGEKRLDVWLCKKSGLSRNRVKRAMDAGDVRVNGRRVFIAGWKLSSGNKVEMSLTAGEGKTTARGNVGAFIKIIYEDRDVIVVDKPHGILSVPQEDSGRVSLADQVKAYLKRKYKTGSYLKALHRLDADTSGAIVFAKSKTGECLEEMFKRHDIGRQYLAVVEGALDKDEGRIDTPLEKGSFSGGRKTRPAGKGGKPAVTEYRVKERYGNATLIVVTVHTGRTHQIRVHLSSIGHPIVGDKLYGGEMSFPRQALHASILSFRHPATGKKMRFESPLPRDMKRLIDELRGI